MATEIGKGIVPVTFDTAQGTADASKSISAGITKIASDAASIWAAKKIFDFGKAGFDELAESQKVAAQTNVIIGNLGDTAGVTSKQVNDLAQSQLRLSGVDDELAQTAENTLLRLGVTGDAFKQATLESNNLAVSMGTDMTSAAQLLGKALASPDKAARVLRPAIGALTAEQQKSITAFMAAGDEAKAQGVILDAVGDKVDGAAAAYGKTLPGQVAIAQESLTNMKAEMVAGMAPALTLGAKGVTFLSTEFGKLPPAAQATVGAVGLVGAGVGSLLKPMRDAVALWDRFHSAQETATTSTEANTVAVEANAVAQTEEAAASEAASASGAGLLGVLGPIGIAVGVAAAAYYGYNHQLTVSVDTQEAAGTSTKDLEKQYLALGDTFLGTGGQLEAFGKLQLGTQERLRDSLKAQGKDTSELDAIIRDETGAQKQANEDSSAGADVLNNDLTPATHDATAGYTTLADKLRDYNSALTAGLDPMFGMLDAMKQQHDAQDKVASTAADVWVKQDALNKVMAEGHPKAADLTKAQNDLATATAAYDAANIDAAKSAEGMQVAADTLSASVLNGNTSLADAKDKLAGWVAQGLLTQAEADKVAGSFQGAATNAAGLSSDLAGLDGRHVSVQIDIARVLTGPGGTHIYQYAEGGDPAPGSLFRGAEQGYELMLLPHDAVYQSPTSGGHVFTHEQSQQILAGAGVQRGPAIGVMNVDVHDPVDVDLLLRKTEFAVMAGRL